ncbi:exodeoxyribonuclease VII large subunit [Sphingomonas mesophila]|uniref:exodeoxyribonuclease VII large subunit n=1 Tax=Sphingomonas mesophila TaxID=2303576 RepID=UPI000E581CB2|nr:exodeoxyribonuclease VII large subunit [Sphingomonas mesophila]
MDSPGPGPDDPAGLLAKVASGDNSPPLSVSELSGALKRTVEQAFGHVRVRGEISGWKRHASGHCYFTLKDDGACIDAVLWRTSAGRLQFAPEDGVEVIATGKLTTYPGRSKYQVVVDRLELAGEGALMALLDRRRRALAAEGLFDQERKRPLPFLPRTIGVVSSPTGAVIRDILHRLAERCPTHVLLWPVPVQGEGAAERVAAAIRGFQALDRPPDLLIVARGGGSIEDLWAFNEEVVVRAAAECRIPLISAVGHETDTTLIDFAADRRAPTPTAAAEIAVPVLAELAATIAGHGERIARCTARRLEEAGERLARSSERWPRPEALFEPVAARLADPALRLPRALAARAAHARADLGVSAARLRPALLSDRSERLREKLAGLWRLAELAHPDRPLEKGFARVTDDSGRTLTSAAAAGQAAHLGLRFADGAIGATPDSVAGGIEPPRRSAYRGARGGPQPPQPGLFDER